MSSTERTGLSLPGRDERPSKRNLILTEIQGQADMANDVIRLGRETKGNGRVKVATCLHHIARLAREALSLPADGWQTKEADRDFTLEWIAAPRPPVHPEPMRGVQSFKSREAANRFAANLAEDAIIVSLVENVTHRRPLTSTPEQGK